MKIRYQRNLRSSYMIVEEEAEVNEDTLLAERMLLGHKATQLLPFVRMEDKSGVCFWYDITGYICLRDYCRATLLNKELIKRVFSSLMALQDRMLELYLKPEHLMLSLEQVFVSTSGESVAFCYLPTSSIHIKEQLTSLTEEMLPLIDHSDRAAVKLGYGLFEEANHENGSIWDFLLNFEEGKKSIEEKIKRKNEEILVPDKSVQNEAPAEVFSSKFQIPGFLRLKRLMKKPKKNEKLYEFCFDPKELPVEKTNPTRYVGPGAAPLGKMIYQGARREESFSINKDSFLVGRSNSLADASLNCEGASRNHAIITRIDGDYYIEDLNSKNGTFINGELLEFKNSVKLNPSDRIRFATEDFIFY